jgi:uncharacterized membrane protein YjfL (UPF0719 family)
MSLNSAKEGVKQRPPLRMSIVIAIIAVIALIEVASKLTRYDELRRIEKNGKVRIDF